MFGLGLMPWHDVADLRIMTLIRQREKLSQPAMCPDEVYQIMLACWNLERASRIKASHVYDCLQLYCQLCGVDERIASYQWPSAVHMRHAALTSQIQPSQLEFGINLNSVDAQRSFSSLEVHRNCIQLQRELGSGAFGSVHLAVLSASNSSNSRRAAVKSLKVDDSEMQTKFLIEAKLLSALRHPHIVELIGVVTSALPFMMVMELMSGGDLQKYLKERMCLIESLELTDICRQVCSAMEHLARMRVIHRDLAARFV